MPRAVVCRAYGSPESLRIEEVASLGPGPGEVLIEVHAAGVNFTDVLVVQNRYQVSASPPFVPGSELAGIVRGVGDGVRGFAVGDRVSAQTFVGAFADEAVLAATQVTKIADGLDFRYAAVAGVAYATAHHALRSVARLRPGHTLLVLGAAGGIGLAAVDIGHLLGARVIAAASTAEKLAVCRDHGADDTVNYANEDLKLRVRALTGGRGVDAVLDPVGGTLAELALRATAWRGRYVSVGFASGEIPRIPLNLVLLKGAEVCGFNIALYAGYEPEEAARDREELASWLRAGKLRAHVSATFPLEEAPAALAAIAERRAVGKIVIAVRGG